jgi:transposase InsO family protein
MLTVLDEYTRQALAVAVRSRMGSEEVLEVLYCLFLRHGKPEFVRSELPIEGAIGSSPIGGGPEFASQANQSWLEKVGVTLIRIYPGSPRGERMQRTFQ